MPRFTLSKEERLSSLKEISILFESGKSITSFPLRLVWKKIETSESAVPPVQVMFSAPKRKFPKAVDRNRIRRLMRENYRLLKPGLFDRISAESRYHLAILFTGNGIPDYVAIQKGMSSALERWLKKIIAETSKEES